MCWVSPPLPPLLAICGIIGGDMCLVLRRINASRNGMPTAGGQHGRPAQLTKPPRLIDNTTPLN
jgi:hypothetical protein